eukprot:COSAG02_NODE_2781_length_8038_cov_3.889533_5_plen_126_part_00
MHYARNIRGNQEHEEEEEEEEEECTGPRYICNFDTQWLVLHVYRELFESAGRAGYKAFGADHPSANKWSIAVCRYNYGPGDDRKGNIVKDGDQGSGVRSAHPPSRHHSFRRAPTKSLHLSAERLS